MMSLLGLFTGSWKKNGSLPAPPCRRPLPPHRPPTTLEERQRLLAHHVRLVARGMANGLCVYGSRGGLGKTRVVLETLKDEGREAAGPERAHHAAWPLHQPVRASRCGRVPGRLRQPVHGTSPRSGILRSALWGETNEKRLVTYNSSQLKIPSSFHFTGRIIFAVNTLPRQNHAFARRPQPGRPVRADGLQRGGARDDAAAGGAGVRGQLTPDECQEVVDFIAEFSATRELSPAAAGAVLPQGHLCTGSRRGLAAARRQPAPRDRADCRPQGVRLPDLRHGVPAAGRARTIPTAWPTRRRRSGR